MDSLSSQDSIVDPIEACVQMSRGDRRSLSELCSGSPLVLVFLRHLGCPFCRQQVSGLRESTLNLVFVCMSPPGEAEAFRRGTKSPQEFICDEGGQLYDLFKLGRGRVKQIVGPQVWGRAYDAFKKGHRTGLPKGDVWRLPGVFILNQAGRILFERRAKDSGDNMSAEEILEAYSRVIGSPD